MNAPKGGRLQLRPAHGDGPAYSPQRDLAYVYAPAMREALRALDQEHWSDELAAVVQTLGCNEEDISAAVIALLEAHKQFVNVAGIASANDALIRANWYDQHPGARYLIYGRLGEVMLGGFFLALRDVSKIADESAQQREIAEFIAEGRKVAGLLDPSEEIDWQMAADVIKEDHGLTQMALVAAQRRCDDVAAHSTATIQAMGDTIERYRNEGFWSGIWRLIRTRLPGRQRTP